MRALRALLSFTDDTHFTGKITYDVGHPCKMELDVSGRRLPL